MKAKRDPQLYRRAKEILLNKWDPIDISDNLHLADEYDAYVPAVLNLIVEGASAQAIGSYLMNIELSLGLKLPPMRRVEAAEALIKLTNT